MHSLSNIRRIQAIREGVACDLTLGGECPAGRDVNAHIHLLFMHQYEVVSGFAPCDNCKKSPYASLSLVLLPASRVIPEMNRRRHPAPGAAALHPLRLKNASNADRASSDLSRRLKISDSSSIRRTISAVEPRMSRREAATASAGSAAIWRAAFRASGSTSPAGTTSLTRPTALASSALIGRPMTRSSKARRVPMRRGINRLEAASGTSPRLTNGVAKRASIAATT